ncbi:hypothetical protein MRX96_009382 [Rhipicephalus microplus]
MAGAASPSPKRHLDTADEFQSSSPTTDNQRRGRPSSRGRSGGYSGPRRRGASKGCSGSRSRSTERARGSSTSQLRSNSRPGPVSSGPTRSRSRSPATSNSKKPTLSWADKARGRRESPRGDESNRCSPHANTSVALHRPSGTKRRAVENTQEEEVVHLLSELKVSFVNLQATSAKIQEAVSHPKVGLGALSERISKLEELDAKMDPGPTPLQVPAQRNVLAPPTEGTILRATIAAQSSPQPKHR